MTKTETERDENGRREAVIVFTCVIVAAMQDGGLSVSCEQFWSALKKRGVVRTIGLATYIFLRVEENRFSCSDSELEWKIGPIDCYDVFDLFWRYLWKFDSFRYFEPLPKN